MEVQRKRSRRMRLSHSANLLSLQLTPRPVLPSYADREIGVWGFTLFNKTPADLYVKRKQGTAEMTTYGSKYVAARTAIEQNTDDHLSISYLGVPVEESFMFCAVHTIMFNPLGSDKFPGRLPVVDKMEPPVHDMSLETEFVTNLTIVFMRHTAVNIRHSVRKRRPYTAFSRA